MLFKPYLSSTSSYKIYFITKRFQNRHSFIEVSLEKKKTGKKTFELDFNQNLLSLHSTGPLTLSASTNASQMARPTVRDTSQL